MILTSGAQPSHLVSHGGDSHFLLQLGTIGGHRSLGYREARPTVLYCQPFHFRLQNRPRGGARRRSQDPSPLHMFPHRSILQRLSMSDHYRVNFSILLKCFLVFPTFIDSVVEQRGKKPRFHHTQPFVSHLDPPHTHTRSPVSSVFIGTPHCLQRIPLRSLRSAKIQLPLRR